MRTDAAAIGGVRDHEIVEPRIGGEAESVEQSASAIVMQIDALDEQCPFATAHARNVLGLERAVRESPGIARMRNESCFRVVARGKSEEFVASERWHDARYGLTNKQRFFLPVPAHEFRRRQIREQRRRQVGSRGQNGGSGRNDGWN